MKLLNFKKFQEITLDFNQYANILIGDNESGKSTILLALDLVLSGSKNKIENIGLEFLFNNDCITNYLETNKHPNKLPELSVELYFNEQNNENLNGKNNTDHRECDGLRLIIKPDIEYINEIINIIQNDDFNFPFEFYKYEFSSFQGKPYTGYSKFVNHIFIDNSKIGNDYAMKEYVNNMFNSQIETSDKFDYQNQYRKFKNEFNNNVLKGINERTENYNFGVKNDSKTNLLTDLTIFENDISIENKGKGKQCFVKTEFAIRKSKKNIDIILIEEPENHLSHNKMQLLINFIAKSGDRQMFITTHNNMISSRLDLKNVILLSNNSDEYAKLNNLNNDTAKYFMKASDHNILEFALSKKVMLVEGDAEYMLMDKMFEIVTNKKYIDFNVSIIAIGGISFKRYLDIAKILKIKTAIIRDNDKDYKNNCEDNYKEYVDEIIHVFSDKDDNIFTFEIAIYTENKKLCDTLFSSPQRKLSIKEYMLKNKTEAAFALLENNEEFKVPEYIKEAIEWIKQ